MRRTCLFLVFTLVLSLLPLSSALPDGMLALSVSGAEITAGQSVTIYYDVPEKGLVDMSVLDASGTLRAVILSEHEADKGLNETEWDGTYFGNALPGGAYTLQLSMNGQSVDIEITIISDAAPYEAFTSPEAAVQDVSDDAVSASAPTAETPAFDPLYPTPALRSAVTPDHDADGCYWCTRMDITDEAAVWAMLTSPITVVNAGQKEQTVVYAQPSESAEGIGVVTGASQGVHVLENRDDGWSLIECYSSSFFDSKVKAWNAFVTGYIKTNKLTKKKVSQEYGIVIDKLTQTLYLFKEGHLFTKLAVSTGLYNAKQPYNETRSGEFMLISKVGDFRSDAMICSMAIRFNGGDLLHEVPHVTNADGSKNYKSTEFKLGSRGSHGCIRVQRLKNADGINMAWLWNNLDVGASGGTKLVIWEDFQGRQITVPDASEKLYYNPAGGSYYHCSATCNGVKSQYLPLTEFSYGQLEDSEFKDLTACPYCFPPMRVSEIEKLNLEHQTSSPGMVNEYHNK